MSGTAPRSRTRAVKALLSPRSVALVGATDKSAWSLNAYRNLTTYGFTGPVHLVNPRGTDVHGQTTHASLAALPGPVDLAYVMVPNRSVLDVLREGADVGIRNYVILTSGFAETGPAGQRAQQDMRQLAEQRDLTILGPNGTGYLDIARGVYPYGLPVPSVRPGSVGVLLQSGALASAVLELAAARNLGLSLLAVMGNESDVSITDLMEHMLEDAGTSVIALFLESIRDPARFISLARRALEAGKPLVALKIGSSPLAASAAQAHTGALVGDDRVVDAVFKRFGVVRVHSLEDLIVTSGLLSESPRVGRRLGVVTPSGGASEVIADRAHQESLELPELAASTLARLTEILPSFAVPRNPLDVTGYVVIDPSLPSRALEVVAEDPNVDTVILLKDLPRDVPEDDGPVIGQFTAAAGRIRSAASPVVVMDNVLLDVTPFGRRLLAETGFPNVMGGIDHTLRAVAAAARWSDARELATRTRRNEAVCTAVVNGKRVGVWVEHQALRLLADNGIPVVPSSLAMSEEAAAVAAAGYGYPVVVKAAAADLLHKSDIGGVRLGLADAKAVRLAHREIVAVLNDKGYDTAGTLVQPQSGPGVELLVGVIRDPTWGLTMAIALGGVWVELLRESVLLILPVDQVDVRAALGELRGSDTLTGARGASPVDLQKLVDAICALADLAVALGPQLESLEVNPLHVSTAGALALDAAVTWASMHDSADGEGDRAPI